MTHPKTSDEPDGLSGLFDLDIEALLASPQSLKDGSGQGQARLDTGHLVHLGRDLVGQYAESIGDFAVSVFSNEGIEASRLQAKAALTSISELASATNDAELIQHLDRFVTFVSESVPRSLRARTRYIHALKGLVTDFADLLEDGDRQKLLSIVEYRGRTNPVISFLRQVRGIGPRRLERMYLAGLHDLDRLCAADADEVHIVTGMPTSLAKTVISEGRVFAEAERKRALHALTERAAWLAESVDKLDLNSAEQRGLITRARDAMRDLERKLSAMAGGS